MADGLLLINGRVLTMDPAHPRATAVAIRNGRIVAVGDDATARAAVPAATETIDLRGRTATPGLYDAHAHPMMVGLSALQLDLSPETNSSIADITARVAAKSATLPKGTWIIGQGYDDARLAEGRNPLAAELDAVAPDHPVILYRMCHHIGAANAMALRLAGVSASTPDPDGGVFDRDLHGAPNGVLRETAMAIVQQAVPNPTHEEMVAAIRAAGASYLATGVTSAVDAMIENGAQFAAYQDLGNRGELPLRFTVMPMIDPLLDPLSELGLRTGFGDDWLRIGGAKLFSDGSIGGRTARMLLPYEDSEADLGLWMMEPEDLKAKVLRAHKAGFQVGIHAIGDAAIQLVLDAYKEAQQADPRPDARHRIEHCSIVDDHLLARIAEQNVVVTPGTSFLYHFREAYTRNLGEWRMRGSVAMRSFIDRGIVAAASTDAPVVGVSAMVGIQTMVTRKDYAGVLINPDECISLDEALHAYTAAGAYASFDEHRKGMLKPGMLADVTVFETDLHAVEPDSLATVKIDHTISDGRVAYSR